MNAFVRGSWLVGRFPAGGGTPTARFRGRGFSSETQRRFARPVRCPCCPGRCTAPSAVEGNTVRDTAVSWSDDGVPKPSEFLDGFQTHNVYDGYGVGNVFSANTVEGSIKGFGFGLYPLAGNTVKCDNKAPGAALGLVGDKSKAASCA